MNFTTLAAIAEQARRTAGPVVLSMARAALVAAHKFGGIAYAALTATPHSAAGEAK